MLSTTLRLTSAATTGVVLLLAAAACDDDTDPASGRWRIDYVTDSRDATFYDLAAVPTGDAWAVGIEGSDEKNLRNLLLRRQGGRWQEAEQPEDLRFGAGADLRAARVDASAADNVWVFGQLSGGVPGMVRWDGQRWLRNPAEFPVRDAEVLAPDDVWALDSSSAGDNIVRHWDGTAWTAQPLPVDGGTLAASGPADVWVRGTSGIGPDRPPAVAHFDGSGWRSVPLPDLRAGAGPDEPVSLDDIVAVSPTEAWLVGARGDADAAGGLTAFVLRWDGTAWQPVPDALADAGRIPARSKVTVSGDGAGGFVHANLAGTEQRHPAGGPVRVIGDPPPVAGRTGKVTDADREQHVDVWEVEAVPGSREVLAVGAVGLGKIAGNARFARGVIVTYRS